MLNRPPGTNSAVFESVSAPSAAMNSSSPVFSFSCRPPCRVIVLLIGTDLLPTSNSPLVVLATVQSSVALLLSGQNLNGAKFPVGWCSAMAGEAIARGAITAIAAIRIRLSHIHHLPCFVHRVQGHAALRTYPTRSSVARNVSDITERPRCCCQVSPARAVPARRSALASPRARTAARRRTAVGPAAYATGPGRLYCRFCLYSRLLFAGFHG